MDNPLATCCQFPDEQNLTGGNGMAKSRTRMPSLAKLFEGSPAFAYVLNLDFEILYASKACAKWVGLELDQLIGQRCVYTSAELNNDTKNRVRGLCPPPAIENKPSVQATVFREEQGDVRYRNVHFTRLEVQDMESSGLIFAIAEPSDRSALEPSVNDDSENLHTQLAALSRELNANYSLNHLVGQSPAANRMRRQAMVAIECNSDLLITGPPATGKAHLANTLFNERKQINDQLVTIHGSLTDREMLQKTVKSWVDDQRDRTGKDWLLILDVDQLDSAAQQELCGFIQLPDFRLRIMATSSRSLLEMAQQRKYDPDLAFYLSTMVIQTTSLAERLEDIPMLAQAFVEERNAHSSRQFGGCSKSALELLVQCRWPRNLDQLKQAVLEACQNAQGPEIQAADFSESIQQRAKATRYETRTELKIDLDAYLESIERELIVRALNQGKQNKSKAAKLLGINRAKLLRRLAHFDLNTHANSDQESSVDASAFLEAADENEASL